MFITCFLPDPRRHTCLGTSRSKAKSEENGALVEGSKAQLCWQGPASLWPVRSNSGKEALTTGSLERAAGAEESDVPCAQRDGATFLCLHGQDL